MAVDTYTGRLTDFGESPFPSAVPNLWVQPLKDAYTASGPAAAKRIYIPVSVNGNFSVNLTPSADLIPPTGYSLRCEWLDEAGGLIGWAQWDFSALPGGGPISSMPGAVLKRIWYATTPPPVNRAGIYWVHPVTDDVREWID